LAVAAVAATALILARRADHGVSDPFALAPTEIREAGSKDAVLDAALARLRSQLELGGVAPLADSALADPHLDGLNRCNVLALRAHELARSHHHAQAIEPLRQLTRWRRHPVDWLLLAECEEKLGAQARAEEAMQTAVRINPRLWAAHQHLADYYRRQGNLKQAQWHQQRALP
jgi:tetratricopeptide (TPR) repeat protein